MDHYAKLQEWKDLFVVPPVVWVFGYGSLMWKTGFPWCEQMPGYVEGLERRFWLLSEDRYGVPGKSGRVATAVPSYLPETQLWGMAYCLQGTASQQSAILAELDEREQGGYVRQTVNFYPRDAPGASFPVILYMASTISPFYSPHYGSISDLAKQILDAEGSSGSNVDYVLRLADAVRSISPDHILLSVADNHLLALERELIVLHKIKYYSF